MEWHEFGSKVRQRREALGISQQEVAAALGIDQAKVSLIERGARRVDVVRELPALAKALKCPISWLCQADESGNGQTDNDPVSTLLKQYFPDIQFGEIEKKRIRQFLEPVITSFVNNAVLPKTA